MERRKFTREFKFEAVRLADVEFWSETPSTLRPANALAVR